MFEIFFLLENELTRAVQMPLDHFSNGSDTRTFRNRYWINQTYYQPGGPVFRGGALFGI